MPQVPTSSGSRAQPGVSTRRAPGAGRGAAVDARMGTPQLSTPQLRGGQARTTQIDPNVQAERTLVTGRDVGADWQRMGQAVAGAGGELGQIANDMQMTANRVILDDAVNKAKEVHLRLAHDKDQGFTRLKGFDALNRPDGKPLVEEYTGRFDESLAEITGNLKNDVQRQAFGAAAADMRGQLESQVLQHEAREFREYNLSVQKGTIATGIDMMQRNYANPEIIAREQARVTDAVAQMGLTNGQSAVEIEANTRTALSKAHTVIVQAALNDGNIGYADAYLNRYADSLEADDLLTLKSTVTKEVDTSVALGVAASVVDGLAPAMAPSEMDQLSHVALETVVLSLEGGGTLADPKVSPKGARGPMQVMPGTNKDPGFGVRPARDDSEAERARVGRDYLAAMVKRYKGDAALALAAYNAGPGRVDDAVEAAQAKGGNWLQHCPPETRQYVANGVRKLGTAAARPPAPTLDDALAQVRSDPRIARSPTRLKIAEQEVERRFGLNQKALRQQEDSAVAEAYAAIDQTGSFDALPPALRQRIPPDKIPTLRSFAASRSKGEEVQTDFSVYYGLKTNPQLLASTNLLAIRDKLGDTEFKELTNAQAAAAKQPDVVEAQVRSDHQILNQYLVESGVDPSPKPGAKDAKVVGKVWSLFTVRVRAAEQAKGGKLSPSEREQLAAGMFTEVDVRGEMFGTKRVPFALAEADKIMVPDADRQQIRVALRQAGQPVTDAAILRAYLVKRLGEGRQGGGR